MKAIIKPKYQLLMAGAIIGVLIVILGFTINNSRANRAEPTNEVDMTIAAVAKHYVLPADEKPALLTVTDNSKVTTPFLKQAKNGDKVLIYKNNKKAIIYRPSADKIVDVGPVIIDTPQKID